MIQTPLRWPTFLFGILAGLVFLPSWVSAQSDSPKKDDLRSSKVVNSSKRPAKPAEVMMTPERQAAALKFAELHHPELHDLVNGLKESQRRQAEYQKAIRQLYRDSERLARLKERVPSRYELALKQWQLDSRLRLLVARMTMSAGEPELQAQLEDLLEKRLETRLALLKHDRKRLAARLARLDEQIQEIEEDPQETIEKDLLRIQRSLGINKRKPNRQAAERKRTGPPPNKSSDPRKGK